MTELTFQTVFFSWQWMQPAGAVLMITFGLYCVGWWRLRRGGFHHLATRWRLVAYSAGQLALGLALLSGIDQLQESLFLMHMIQHELLLMIAPPLLWLGNPLPISLWGFPRHARLSLGMMLRPKARFRRALHMLTPAGISWMAFVGTTLLWHDPMFYQAALENRLIHDLEHLTFFFSALLFWWHITGAYPRIHRQHSYVKRIGLLILSMFINQALGGFLALSDTVLYEYYTTVPRINDISALTDQNIGGVIMWVPGGMMYALTAVLLIVLLSNRKEKSVKKKKPEVTYSYS